MSEREYTYKCSCGKTLLVGEKCHENLIAHSPAADAKQLRANDRKSKIELTLAQAQKIDGTEAIQAWRRLIRELEFMTHPESRPPRFNGLLHAVWIAASNDQT